MTPTEARPCGGDALVDTRTGHMPGGAAVTFENVSVAMGGVTILDKVSASAPQGGCTAIVGPNGAGKTSLLLALLGEIPFTGRIRVTCGEGGRTEKGAGAGRIGYVPQHLDFDRGLPMTVHEFMVMGSQRLPLWFGCRSKALKRAHDLLAMVRAEALGMRKLGALSGGEMQRVLLALALQQEPDLLVLDEPASGVDFQGENLFCEILEKLRRTHGFTQLMVSHDLATVTHHATHVICLNRRVAAEGPPREVLTHENLAAVFGVHMGVVDSRSLPHDAAGLAPSCCAKGHEHA